MLADLLGFPPYEGQIGAIRSRAVDRLDLILIVPTPDGVRASYSQAISGLARRYLPHDHALEFTRRGPGRS